MMMIPYQKLPSRSQGSTPVVEGDPLVFELTASNPPLTDGTVIIVNVRVTETGDFLATPAKDSSQRLYCRSWKHRWNVIITNSMLMRMMKPNAKVKVMLVGEDTSGQNLATVIPLERPRLLKQISMIMMIRQLASVNIVPVSATVAEAAGANGSDLMSRQQ